MYVRNHHALRFDSITVKNAKKTSLTNMWHLSEVNRLNGKSSELRQILSFITSPQVYIYFSVIITYTHNVANFHFFKLLCRMVRYLFRHQIIETTFYIKVFHLRLLQEDHY